MKRNQIFQHSDKSYHTCQHHAIVVFIALASILSYVFYDKNFFLHTTYIDLKYKVELIQILNVDIPKPEFLVYHQGGMYIDPVDPERKRCLIAWDYTNDINIADVIVYNVMDNGGDIMRPQNELSLRPSQVTVIESMESSSNYMNYIDHQHKFNYTMDYRLTSDVPIPYSEYFESSEKPLNLSEKKGNVVAAFISNCGANNGRTEYVNELMKYIKVDSYGSCLNNKQVPGEWSHSGGRDQTKQTTISHYKFTLSFENSNDQDYITEKLYQPLRYGSVPIFRGCGQVEDFAPPHSVIDANKFASAQKLAEYINYLDQNDTAYNEYLKWKETGDLGNLRRIRFFRDRYEYGVCALLERIKNLWINPFLTDWKRVSPNTTLACSKCLEDFDVSTRRVPYVASPMRFEMPEPSRKYLYMKKDIFLNGSLYRKYFK